MRRKKESRKRSERIKQNRNKEKGRSNRKRVESG